MELTNKDEMKDIDIFYIGYYMMIEALKRNNIYDGLKKSLYLIKMYMKCDDIVLFKMDETGEYVHYSNQVKMDTNSSVINIILNKAKNLIENKDYFKFDMKITDKIDNIIFIPIEFDNFKYMIAISNLKNKINKNIEEFIKIIKESMSIILSNLEIIKKLEKSGTTDILTSLDNRNSYIIKTEEINNNDKNYVYAIFDLFRLKYINDNFGHDKGDDYIIKTAEILKRYFPKYYVVHEKNGSSKTEYTGSCVYRIGGDEFILITDCDTIDIVNIKTKLILEEVKNIDLGIQSNVQLAINYGIVSRNNKETSKELYIKADKILMQDKNNMYKEYGLERRK